MSRIKINATKSQPKIFTLRRPKMPDPLKIKNVDIKWNRKDQPVRYVGVLLDQKLTWKYHIKEIANKTYVKLAKLYPIINRHSRLKIECGITLFKTIIRPSLTYACPIWGGAAKRNLDKLQIVQNKFLRRIIKAPWYLSNKQIRYELQIEKLNMYIRRLSEKFFEDLAKADCAKNFNLGCSAKNIKINSRFPKDKLRPP